MTAACVNQHRFAHEAMATTFQITLAETDPVYARQAAAAAFDELDLLESHLSRFVESSDISRINRLAPGESTVVALDTFQCLQIACDLKQQTEGAFDTAYGSAPTLGRAEGIELAVRGCAVHVLADGLRLDLGGIGKGFALDRMADVLREWEIEAALLRASTSTVLALGSPRDKPGWPIQFGPEHDRQRIVLGTRRGLRNAVGAPLRVAVSGRALAPGGAWAGAAGCHADVDWARHRRLAPSRSLVTLRDVPASAHGGAAAMREQQPLASGGTAESPFGTADRLRPPFEPTSAAFSASGTAVKGSHISDPRTGTPAEGPIRCWAGAPTAAAADGLSTAFMVMTEGEVRAYCRRHREVSAYVLRSKEGPVLALSELSRGT